MSEDYFAHSTQDPTRRNWQPAAEHLNATSDLARAAGDKFRAGRAAALGGGLHDLGKYTQGFVRRLAEGPLVDHSTAGAQEAVNLTASALLIDRVMGQLIAYAIAGHHGGMPDWTGDSGSLEERLRREIEAPDPVWRDEISIEASDLFPADFKARLPERTADGPATRGWQFGFLGRMIFSCIVDADYRDTEAFYARAAGRPVLREQASLHPIIDDLIVAFDRAIEGKRAEAAAAGTEHTLVNRIRRAVLERAISCAVGPPDIYTLSVPTGGAKTLVSLGFGLHHAKANNLDRIIYVIPYTSVIDQTADIFRAVLGKQHVLEHHSALDDEMFRKREGADKLQLAMEDWSARIVVTTAVQFFESLFSNRPSRCRKLHNIANSVIILDEAQTLPLHVLRPCVAALDELVRNYGVSVVLCTATQPALMKPRFEGGFAKATELAPDPARLFEVMQRVTIRHAGTMDDTALVAALETSKQGLVIVNSRRHARRLYRLAAARLDGVVHLTTRQYAAHRRVILADIRDRLARDLPCRVIATSLIEAGVDLDFPAVWRAEAGLDQIAQAAGRCNREGKRSAAESVVTVFRPAQDKPPTELRPLIEAAGHVIERYQNNVLTPDTIRRYFHEVYWRRGRDPDGLDTGTVLSRFRASQTSFDMAYRTVAEGFRLITTTMVPIIIARDAPAIAALQKLNDPAMRASQIARSLQSYIVQVPDSARARLMRTGAAAPVHPDRFGEQFVVLRATDLYSDDTGLTWENNEDGDSNAI